MHKLDRTSVTIPECLVNPPEYYKNLHGIEKTMIRTTLLMMQRQRCAYCERLTGENHDDGHIEHFRDQANHPELQCNWDNLFWSCNDEKTCGKYKDGCKKPDGLRRSFDPSHIINPACDDPETFLLFVSDGTVRPNDDLSTIDKLRAEETLRVFQLNESSFLRKSRENAVKPYIDIIDILIKLNPEHVPIYIQDVLNSLSTTPFETAIRSFLRSVL